MKKQFFLILLFCFFHSNLFAGEHIIAFKLAYEHEESDTFIVEDENIGKLFIGNTSIIKLSDIAQAKLVVDSRNPPLWLDSAFKTTGVTLIHPQINIEIIFNSLGKDRFAEITSENVGKRIAVFIDNKFVMAPKIIDKIDSGKALISTSFSENEAREIVDKINDNLIGTRP